MGSAAVITADIVNSITLSPSEVKKLVTSVSSLLQEYKFEFYRGDSFQVYLKNPSAALKIVLRARCIARSHSPMNDIRASIGIGGVSSPVRSLRTATGKAFIISGRAFDQMTRSGNERLKIESVIETANPALRIVAYYIDYIFSRLTPTQSEVMNVLLEGYTQVEVAKKLKKTQPTVAKIAQAAGWSEIERLLQEYQNIMNQFEII
jgi:hypothetical protein